MGKLIILALVIWATVKVFSAVSARRAEIRRQAEIDRINAETRRQREEQMRIDAEIRQQRMAHNAEIQRMIQLEAEQTRQRKEQERIAKEQAKQAAQIAKHEEQLAKLEFRVSEAERTIAHYTPVYEALKGQYDELTLKIRLYEQRGLLCGTAKKDLVKISDKLYAVETKLNKAKFDKEQAERKIA